VDFVCAMTSSVTDDG